MATLKDRISNKAYKTWLKAGLCLGFLKEGLCPFINRESQTLHSNVLAKVRQSVLGTGVFGPLPQCTICTAQDITWSNRGRRWELTYVDPTTGHVINHCPNHLCHHFMTAIQQEHVSPQPRGMCWKNGNTQAWPSSHWEVAKTLMDVMEGGPMKTSPEDCDCSSLLKFIEYSNVCQGKISVADAAKVRQHRNKIMHSATMELCSTELKIFANDMVTLLESLGDYKSNSHAQKAVDRIKQARDTDIKITTGDEIQVLKAAQEGMQETVNKQLEDMKEMKKAVDELETKTKEMEDTDKKTEEQEEEIQQLKKKVQEVETKAKEMEDMNKEVKEKTEEQGEEMQQLKKKVQEVKTKTKETEDMNKEVKEKRKEQEEEMQQLKKKVQEVETKTKETEDMNKEVKEKTKEQGEEMQQLKKKVQEVETKTKEMEDMNKEVKEKTEEQGEEMQQLKKKVQEVETKTKETEDMNKEVKEKTKEQGEEMQQLKKKVQEVETKTKEMEDMNKEVKEKTKEQEEEMQQLKEGTRGMLEKQGKKMEKLEKRVKTSREEMKKTVNEQSDMVEQLKMETRQKLEEQEEEMGRLKEKMEEEVDGLKETVDASEEEIRKTVKEQSEEMKSLKQSQAEMKKELEEKLTYIETIEGRLRELQSPERQHELKCRELKEKLIKMYRNNCMEIPVSPLHTKILKKTFPIQQLYTDLVLVEQEQRDSRGRTEEGKQRTETPLKSYSEVFCKGDKRRNTIFVLGEAGTGKSTLAKKMAADWVCAHTGSIKEKDPDVAVMEKFKFLFYVPLRAVSDCRSVFDAVCQSVAKYSDFNDTIKRLFQTQSEEILVICDGLDEVKPVLEQHHLHDCTVVTTTRPWKFDLVDQRDHHVDAVLELRGLNEEGVDYLTGKVLEAVHGDTSAVTKHIVQKALGRDDYFFYIKVAREQAEVIRKAPTGSEELRSLSKIPLLLVFFIDVWFKGNKSLPTSLTELFTSILVINLKCGENRLIGLENREACQNLWQECSHLKKMFGKNDEHLTSYLGLLTCVANFALQALICPNHEHSLVFEKKDVEKHFDLKSDKSGPTVDSSAHVDACVILGLLTKTEYPSFLGDEYTYSFPHKSIQEFLAAVGIVQSKKNGRSKFIQYCTSVRVLLEMSNVFKFVCGLSPETGSAISEELVKMYNVDLDILKWRHECNFWSDNVFKATECERLTSLYCDCVTENRDKGSSEILHMSDFVDRRYWRDENRTETMLTLINSNRTDLATLKVRASILQCMDKEALSHMNNLVKLHVHGITSHSKAINSLLEATVNLQNLTLEGEKGYSCDLCLPVLQHLNHLKLKALSMNASIDLLQQLKTLLSVGRLETVHLVNISFDNFSLDLSPLVQLSELILEVIDMTWSVWCGLLSSLGSCHSLKTLYIKGIRPYREDTCIPDTRMDLSGCTQLQRVDIWEVNIGDIQLDFSPLVQLSELRLWSIDMTWSVWCGLLSSLGSCHSLKTLSIHDIRPDREDTCTPDTRMDLSGCTQLQKVDIVVVNIGDIQLDFSPLVQLSELRLVYIDMTWSVWCGLLSSLGSCHSLKTLYIKGIRPDREDTCTPDTRMDLSGCTQLQEVVIERVNIGDIQLDLSPLVQLSELRLWSIDMTWSVWCGLLSSLGSCHSLKTLSIQDIRPDREDTRTSDTRMDLSGCTQLQKVDIGGVNIGDIQLDFSPLVQLSELRLEVIDMTWSVWCGLLSSLGSCHSLKTLYIKGIRPDREDTCTPDTRMDLSGCTQLQEVVIERVNIGDIQLDLSPLVQLSELRLWSIDMTWSVWCGLLSSLGSCHSLKTLSIQDIRPDREDTRTSDTRMDLSGCTQLQEVDIVRVNIGDIQLEFSPLVQLSKLTLVSIDMAWSLWCGLLSSLGSCHSLKTLYIKGIRPDREDTCTPDTRMDLSGCTQLQEVVIERVNIGDIQLDFSPLVQLSELTLVSIDMAWSLWCGLLSSLGSCHSLETLDMEGIRSDREDTCTSDTLGTEEGLTEVDLSGCRKLLYVTIIHSYVCTVTDTGITNKFGSDSTRYLSPLVSSLSRVTCLTELNVCYLDPDGVKILKTVLPHLCNLTKLTLQYINFGDHRLSLDHNQQLQELSLDGAMFTAKVLDLSRITSMKKFNLSKTIFVNEKTALHQVPPMKKTRFDEAVPGTGQLVLASNMELQELVLHQLTLSEDTWSHVFTCVHSMKQLQKLQLKNVNTTMNMVRVPAHMHIKDKRLDEDSTISSLECRDRRLDEDSTISSIDLDL